VATEWESHRCLGGIYPEEQLLLDLLERMNIFLSINIVNREHPPQAART
jgi:hypothetical protein